MNRKNYRAVSTPATVRRQGTIREILRLVEDGLTVSELGRALGMSRQLALYHVKKMAALGLIVMQLEPCEENGGVRFRIWDEMSLAARYTRMVAQAMPSEVRRAA